MPAALDRWASRTYDHPLHDCFGYILAASTRARARVQRGDRQRHKLGYFVKQLHESNSAAGLIMYNIDVSTHPLTAAFRTGPAGLDLHRYDVLHHSGTASLTLIAGMCKTWTRPHVDTAGDSVWQQLVQGEKLWILARPEKKDEMKAYFHDERTVHWSHLATEDSDWLADNRCYMVLQRAGDLLYIPSGWPHMCSHLTDTIALNCNLLHSRDFTDAIDSLDFARLSDADFAMYEAAYQLAVSPTTPAALRCDAAETQAVWERKQQQREAGTAERERAMKEAAAQGRPAAPGQEEEGRMTEHRADPLTI